MSHWGRVRTACSSLACTPWQISVRAAGRPAGIPSTFRCGLLAAGARSLPPSTISCSSAEPCSIGSLAGSLACCRAAALPVRSAFASSPCDHASHTPPLCRLHHLQLGAGVEVRGGVRGEPEVQGGQVHPREGGDWPGRMHVEGWGPHVRGYLGRARPQLHVKVLWAGAGS